jgi:HPt (histidine-containing phosphotransfer) domain-containing protein
LPDQNREPPTTPPAGVSAESALTIDESLLDSYRVLQDEGQPDVVAELIDIYLDDLPERLASVREALSAGEPSKIRSAAHALKGSSASIGAVRLAAICGDLEAIGKQGITAGASDLLPTILTEADRAAQILDQMRR